MKYNKEKLELNMSDFGPDYYSIYNGSYYYYNQGRALALESTWPIYTVLIGWVIDELKWIWNQLERIWTCNDVTIKYRHNCQYQNAKNIALNNNSYLHVSSVPQNQTMIRDPLHVKQ